MRKHNLAFQSLSNLFSVLSHPARLRIIGLLRSGEMDVSHLQQELDISQSGVSQHLHLLKANGLLDERKEGKHVYYRIKSPQVLQLITVALQYISIDLMSETEALAACTDILSMWT